MLRLLHNPDGLGTFGGSVAAPVAAKTPRPNGTRVKAPLAWRVRNTVRMALSLELFIPLYVWLLKRVSPRGVGIGYATLYGVVTKGDGTRVNYGVLGFHLVTTAGKNFIASAFDNTVELEIMKYHAFGTGNTAANIADTALQTELTTQYAVSNTRPTGSQGHSSATYTTVGTIAPTANVALTEWGLMSQASNAGGTLLDRQVFSVVNLVGNADSLATTYVFTVA